MQITYLAHSGFLLEWEHCYWIFDYYKGEIPTLNPHKEVFIFCSHSHEDHFNPEIFNLLSYHPSTTYFFSDEIKRICEKKHNVQYMKNRAALHLITSSGEVMNIRTLQSTDLGCAFFIEYNNKVIYHAGDLHWWYWAGEPDSWNKQMTEDYQKEVSYLEGKHIDLAFTPLDPRQEKDYALGINYFLEHTHTKHVFPMHFWDNYQIMEQYLQEYSIPEHTTFNTITQNGQMFDIVL